MKENKKANAPAKKSVAEVKGKIARVDLVMSTNKKDGTYGHLVIGALLRTVNADGKTRGAFAPLAEHLKDTHKSVRATWSKWLRSWDYNKDADKAINAVDELATLLGVEVGNGATEYAPQGKRCETARLKRKESKTEKAPEPTRTEAAVKAIKALDEDEAVTALRQAAKQIAPDKRRVALLKLIEEMDEAEAEAERKETVKNAERKAVAAELRQRKGE
jgi:hypothetical protein